MAHQLLLFMDAEDERGFLRLLSPDRYEVYPRRIPADWRPFLAAPDGHERLPPEDVYLHAADLGPALVDAVKRGKDKGTWRIDEVRSPVIFWERCVPDVDEPGTLRSGQLWAELDVTSQTGRKSAASDRFRARFLALQESLRKAYRTSNPRGFLIGPSVARAVKAGSLRLKENVHWGRDVTVHR
jgi:hypothetical protein